MQGEAGKKLSTHLCFNLPSENYPRAIGYTDTGEYRLDGQRAARGRGPDRMGRASSTQSDYALTIPGSIGIIVVGILGVMMLTLSISGVIAHPRIFRDAFRLRARRGGGIGLADWHNRMSVWSLPFIVMIALTGAVIGLRQPDGGRGGRTLLRRQGRRRPTRRSSAAKHPVDLARTGKLPAIVKSLDYVQAHYPDVKVTYFMHPRPDDQGDLVDPDHGRASAPPDLRRILQFRRSREFRSRGRSGRRRTRPAGRGIELTLHFGSYGGLPVKIACFLLGLALTAICATGTLYLARQAPPPRA